MYVVQGMILAWFVPGILGPAGYVYSVIFYNTQCIDTMCFVYTCIISCQSHMYVRIYVNVWYPVCKRARMQADMLSNSMFSCRRSRDLSNARTVIATITSCLLAHGVCHCGNVQIAGLDVRHHAALAAVAFQNSDEAAK